MALTEIGYVVVVVVVGWLPSDAPSTALRANQRYRGMRFGEQPATDRPDQYIQYSIQYV